MKKLLIGLTFLASTISFAGTTLVDQPSAELKEGGVCELPALKKTVAFAMENKAQSFDVYTFRLIENDKKIMNPSHYSWYELDVVIDGETKTIRTLVQKNRLSGDCI